MQDSFFSEILREDAKAVFQSMQTPTVLRLRADANPDEHPLLSMRLSRMERLRDMMKSYAMGLLEGDPPLNTPQQAEQLADNVRRAMESCLRVLECTTDQKVLARVASVAHAISNTISNIAHTVASRGPDMTEFASLIREEARKAADISRDVDGIASEMKETYDGMRFEIAQTGDRIQEVGEERQAAPGQ